MMFILVASVVWGGLGFTLREMFRDRGDDDYLLTRPSIVESSMQTEDVDSSSGLRQDDSSRTQGNTE
ncbi:MAG: hypothetical protein ACJZ59_07825 [Candidatus Thalassarchaeaceae archaeon]